MAGSQGSDAPLRLLLVEDMPQVAQLLIVDALLQGKVNGMGSTGVLSMLSSGLLHRCIARATGRECGPMSDPQARVEQLHGRGSLTRSRARRELRR